MNLFKKLPLSQLLIVSFLIIVLGFLSVNIFTFININKLVASAEIQTHTIEVLEELEQILASLSDAETGQRGYLLTGELKYLEPYNSGIANVSELIEVTRKLTADNPNQQERITVLEGLVEEKKAELRETVDLRAEGKSEEAINIVLSDKGKNIMDNIRVVISDMRNEENVLLAVRQEDFHGGEEATKRAIVFGSTAGLLASIYIALVISGFIGGSIAKIGYAASEIAKGNMDVRVDTTGSNEISNVSGAIETMRKNLKESFRDIRERTKQVDNQLQETNRAKEATQDVLEDVEEEKQRVTEEKAKVEAILSSIGDGVFVVDTDFKISVFNEVAEEISGYTVKEAIGNKYEDVLKFVLEKNGQPHNSFIKDTIASGKPHPMSNHTLLIRKDGSTVPVADSAAPLKDEVGNVIGCVVVFRDATKEREVDRMKSEFVSVASHQLRTPLTAINWFIEMLLSEESGKLTAEQKDYLNEVYTGSKRMVRLVNDLLNVSRLETGRLKIEPEATDVVAFIADVIKGTQLLAKAKNCTVRFDHPDDLPKIPIDPTLLRQVIHNLVTNAIKYSVGGGKKDCVVEVELVKSKQNSHYLVRVTDSGIGIPEQLQPRIFEKFFRADNAVKTEAEGSGLGLYVAKMIMEASGGEIGFESEEGRGTMFYVAIPKAGMTARKGARGLVDRPSAPEDS